MKNWFKTFKNDQKVRVVVSGVQVFTRADEVVDSAVHYALAEIDRLREAGDPCVGLTGNFVGKAVQVDLVLN